MVVKEKVFKYLRLWCCVIVCCLLDVESVAESTGSRNLRERSMSQTSAIDDAARVNESQNNRMGTTRPKKRQKAMV